MFAGWVADCHGGPVTSVHVNGPKQCAPWFQPIVPVNPRTLVSWDSAPGDYIGQGQKNVYAPHNSLVTAFSVNGGNGLELTITSTDRTSD